MIPIIRIVFFALVILSSGCATSSFPEKNTNVDAYYLHARDNTPARLTEFLREMPKGGDLHNHLSGAIYAESYINWATDNDLCIDTVSFILYPQEPAHSGCHKKASMKLAVFIQNNTRYDALVNALSMRNFTPNPGIGSYSGHDHFFNSFFKFDNADVGRMGEMLVESMQRAAQQNILYLELMTSPYMSDARKLSASWKETLTKENFDSLYHLIKEQHATELAALVSKARSQLDNAERQAALSLQCQEFSNCPVTVRYIAQVIRVFPPEQVFAQSILAYELMKEDKRVVGVNFVAPEDDRVTLRDYDIQMEMLGYLSKRYAESNPKITLHAGELALGLVSPEHLESHITKAVMVAGAKRIGHGVDIFYENNASGLLQKMSEDKILVEINLTSNDVILGVKGKGHPFPAYMEYKVPVTLSTDDEGVSRINLTHEYQRAALNYHLSYQQLKMLSRNGLEYAFLPGESFWKGNKTGTAPDQFELRYPVCHDVTSLACEAAVSQSEKASLQRQLEIKFNMFEGKYGRMSLH